MIRDPESAGFLPGSFVPKAPQPEQRERALVENPEARAYLEGRIWTEQGLLMVGPSGVGKTMLGFSVLHAILEETPVRAEYWTESDYLQDLRALWRFEEMTQRLTRDDGLWAEYVEWEQHFWGLKEAPLLFLDDVGRSYTPMQWYEMESLVRFRLVRSLPTMLAVVSGRWRSLSDEVRPVLERNNLLVHMEDNDEQ